MRADTRLPPYLPYPRFLLQADLTQTAKLLYALLLDRAMLSQSNGWLDESGRIYLVFPIEKIAAALDRSTMTVKTALSELEDAGLIERRRSGFSKPNRIYVKLPPDGQKTFQVTDRNPSSIGTENCPLASQVEDEVTEYTRKIVRNPQFIKDLQEKVMTAVDMTEVENDITAYKNQLSALQRSRDSLEQDIDRIAPDDKYAERRRADMTRRLNDLYDQIYKAEDLLQESMMKKATLESEQMSVQSMIGILSSFDAIYDRMNAAERRDLVKYLISEVELFPREEQKR